MTKKNYLMFICTILYSYIGCMEIQSIPALNKDVLDYLFMREPLSSVCSFLHTCKQLYTIYSNRFEPISCYLTRNKQRCKQLTRKQHLYGLMYYAQTNNKYMMKLLIDNESLHNKRWRSINLLFFGYDYEHLEKNFIQYNINAYRAILVESHKVDCNDLFFNTGKVWNSDVIQILLHNGVRANIVDKWGRTILHEAIRGRYPLWFLKELLNYGVNINQKDMFDESPLDMALRFYIKAAYFLYENGAHNTLNFKKYLKRLHANKKNEPMLNKMNNKRSKNIRKLRRIKTK